MSTCNRFPRHAAERGSKKPARPSLPRTGQFLEIRAERYGRRQGLLTDISACAVQIYAIASQVVTGSSQCAPTQR